MRLIPVFMPSESGAIVEIRNNLSLLVSFLVLILMAYDIFMLYFICHSFSENHCRDFICNNR